jgi:hypothetical protein
MKCILHIGTEKTGSTSLQSFLCRNADLLANQSFRFPTLLDQQNHFPLVMAVRDFDDETIAPMKTVLGIRNPLDFVALQQRLRRELRTAVQDAETDTLLLTSEHLHQLLTTHAQRVSLRTLLESVGIDEFEVVIYLRRPADLINSWYSTALRCGILLSEPPPATPRNIISPDCRYDATVQGWEQVFGRDALRVRIFERSTLVGHSVIDDFCATAGIQLESNMVIPLDENSSLSHDSVEILRLVLPELHDLGPRSIGKIAHAVANATEQALPPSQTFMMSERLQRDYDSEYADSNESVRARYFPQRTTLFDTARIRNASTAVIPAPEHARIAALLMAEVRAASRSKRAMQHLPNKLIKVLSRQYAHDHQNGGTISFVDRLFGRQTALRKAA